MTAYLKPGDKVHIVYPLVTNLSRAETEKSNEDLVRGFTKIYARMGITAVECTGVIGLKQPYIMAVVRDE